MTSPHLARIFVYPIKSLDGLELHQTRILPSGALSHDREYALVDADGRVVNAKRTAQIHQLRSHLDLQTHLLTLETRDRPPVTFHLDHGRVGLEAWFSDYFGLPIRVMQNTEMGFPDDTVARGPTVISTATIEAIASWFPDLSTDEVRRRFRANLEIDGVPAFWEDQLVADADQGVEFQIGSVTITGINPCQRCIVPTRDSYSGDAIPQFQKHFNAQRQDTLPDWVTSPRFTHLYRLSINTNILNVSSDHQLTVGDAVQILGVTAISS